MKQTFKLPVIAFLILTSMAMYGNEVANDFQKVIREHVVLLSNLEDDFIKTEDIHKSDPVKKSKSTKTDGQVFIERGERVFVVLKNPEMMSVDIEIRDGFDRLIYSETITESKDILKSFNFKKAYIGYYAIKVQSGKDSFIKEIVIR